jgi:hypothetical protein
MKLDFWYPLNTNNFHVTTEEVFIRLYGRSYLPNWKNRYIIITEIQGVQMKGIQNKKNYISETNCHTCIQFMLLERKTLKVFFFFHAWLMHVRQLVTFSSLSNDVDTTRTGSMHVVASRVAISYGCLASF